MHASALSKLLSSLLPATLCLIVVSPPSILAASWSAPEDLNSGLAVGQLGSVATDSTGNAVAIWTETLAGGITYQVQARSIASSGALGPVQVLGTPSSSSLLFPQVRMSSSGTATAFWTDNSGVWSADEPLHGAWSNPILVLGGTDLRFAAAEDHSGDAAIVAWKDGSNPGASLRASRRLAGAAWTALGNVATVPGYSLNGDEIAISPSGDIAVTWESFLFTCGRPHHCYHASDSVYVSRWAASTGKWQRSGTLATTNHGPLLASVTIDDPGAIGVAYIDLDSSVKSWTQTGPGVPWNGPVVVNPTRPADSSFNHATIRTDSAGHATILVGTTNSSVIDAFAGNLLSNRWGSPQDLQTGQYLLQSEKLYVSPNGKAAAIWVSQGPFIGVFGSVRESETGAWSAPVRLSHVGANWAGSPFSDAVAISESGQAFSLFDDYTASYKREVMSVAIYR